MRRILRRLSYRDLSLIAAFALGTVWMGFLTWGIVGKWERARDDVRDTRGELASLQAREATLNGNLTELGTERGQEAAMRDTEGVARPGEGVIIVVPEAPDAPATTTRPWWRSVLDWF